MDIENCCYDYDYDTDCPGSHVELDIEPYDIELSDTATVVWEIA